MKKTALSTEQSHRLIELGVDPSRASGEKVFVDIHPEVLKGNAEYAKAWGYISTFTLSDVLSILPTEIDIHPGDDTLGMVYHCGQWRVGYSNYKVFCDHTKVAPELIDALFELLVWCITNKHIEL